MAFALGSRLTTCSYCGGCRPGAGSQEEEFEAELLPHSAGGAAKQVPRWQFGRAVVLLMAVAAAFVTCAVGTCWASGVATSEAQPGVRGRLDATFIAAEEEGDYDVFLQVFRLRNTSWLLGGLYHSEVLVCPRMPAGSGGWRRKLAGEPAPFLAVDERLWDSSTVECMELAYGGNSDRAPCSGVMLRNQSLSARKALISNVEQGIVWKYWYGTGTQSGEEALQRFCGSCGKSWAGLRYRLLSHNCNTFTSSILHCVYGLSQKKPGLGISDLVNVDCPCGS